jgi:hypothetical protein
MADGNGIVPRLTEIVTERFFIDAGISTDLTYSIGCFVGSSSKGPEISRFAR